MKIKHLFCSGTWSSRRGCGASASRGRAGLVLAAVLWTLVLLTSLALGLGRQTQMELALTDLSVKKLQSKYAATAGVFYAMERIREDSLPREQEGTTAEEQSANQDTAYRCGVRIEEGQDPKEIFSDIPVGESRFTLRIADPLSKGAWRYGLQAEESKLNLNALTPENYEALEFLVMEFGYPEKTAETVASSVLDWKDVDGEIFNEPYGTENILSGPPGTGTPAKNAPFDSVNELRMVRGVTPELFRALRPFLTVFPKEGKLLVNFDTAPEPVLTALAGMYAGPKSNTSVEDAQSLVRKLSDFRNGSDNEPATEDDRVIDLRYLALNAKERVVFLLMSQHRTLVSDYLRVVSRGTDQSGRVSTTVEAVVHRRTMAVVAWQRK